MSNLPFRIKSASYNTSNIEDLTASLNVLSARKEIEYTFTPTQLINLPTSPFLLIPSPGDGNITFIEQLTLTVNFNTTPYTGPTSNNVGIFYGTQFNNSNSASTNFSALLTGFTYTGSSITTTLRTSNGTQYLPSLVNAPLYLLGTGAPFANGDSNCDLNILYTIHST